ncbi:MAG TPA: Ig-like domain-containing protein [Gemmatimonadaceae bacterium]|nr:Ig-like domain-containing protein [Gemmatimonadaceae bacterium]
MRLTAVVAALGVAACASIGSPPGGPERTTPPTLLSVSPESGSVNVRARYVVFQFDAVVSDRSGGASGIEGQFLVSPSDGAPRVRWRRDRVEVRPRDDFRPNTAYAVTMLPGVADLRGNVNRTARTVVFSTGPTIPQFAVLGRVFDWSSERVAPDAYIEVIRRSDSLRYVGTADSTGQFSVGPLEEGAYAVRAIIDNNRNRAVDPGEPWDTVDVTIRGTSPFLELLAAQRDTIAPRLLTVAATDSITIAASFDRLLNPDVPLSPASFQVFAADSSRLRIVRVLTQAQATLERARDDSIARADSARRDTTRRVQPPPTTAPAPIAARPSRRPPPRDVIIRVDSLTPLQRGATYRVVAVNASGLLGTTRTSERLLNVPARRDTTASPAARRDSTAPPPAARRP